MISQYTSLFLHMPHPITVQTSINASIEQVWNAWTNPVHITKWAFASPEWEAPTAENDVRVGGTFTTLMAAKDKSASFDFTGVYTDVKPLESLAYTMEDGRKVSVSFTKLGEVVHVTETFDPENENPEDMQRSGWQAILDNFKQYVETLSL